jgi:UDP-N-acetylmuramyl pentapeptide phosphotransferase/UDP-N-acetylglucosamine-1-phosphate transferase
MLISKLLLSLIAASLAAMLCALIISAIRPLLLRYTLAKPTVRSSHRTPTPQGAGIAVISATLAAAAAIIAFSSSVQLVFPYLIFGATLFIAMVGLADDIRFISVIPRLILQALAVGAVLIAVSGDFRIIAALPVWIEAALLLLAGLWFVNLVNFMDGLDWMTVAEVVPITAAMVVLGWFGEFPRLATIVAAALCGATVGFAPFNRPVAKVFLGDVGSLPIGLLLGWCLLQLAYNQQIVAALLLPLYYLSDATVTLLRRLTRGERFWAAHRSHFYQRATDNGFTVMRVVSEVFALNIALAVLAIGSIMTPSAMVRILFLIAGGLATALVMYGFSRRRS